MQEILTYTIIALAVAYAIYKIVKAIFAKREKSLCEECNCDVRDEFRKKMLANTEN